MDLAENELEFVFQHRCISIMFTIFLEAILSYAISLAVNERSAAITKTREEELKAKLADEEVLREAIALSRSFKDEVKLACSNLSRSGFHQLDSEKGKAFFKVFNDELFQDDLAQWLVAGELEEGEEVRIRISSEIEDALAQEGCSPEEALLKRQSFLENIERAIFSNPLLARWRHHISLEYLKKQVESLRIRAENAAGIYSPNQQKSAISRYCEKALAAFDIIDLSNLPEGDIHMVTQKLLLRQLYMPLRINVESFGDSEDGAEVLTKIEEARETKRRREAGYALEESIDFFDGDHTRFSMGERLDEVSRLVILGDPGGGKTTMLRWIATCYLLRFLQDGTFEFIPDSSTLPDRNWIPVLIRCRDLGEADLCRCFSDFLKQQLYKSELLPEEADIMLAVILNRLAKGEILLLIDGLDEISNVSVRTIFCQEIERTAARYPDAAIIVTSRIVGYRDMPYRMGVSFEHGVIAELSSQDKDVFASRWVEVTEQHHTTEEKSKRAQELLDALHSSDRIERLTGNPMLLTTLALVKRKVGKLPNKRNRLYAEAVSVLLNWNPRVYQTIEEDEAIPQLEYIAYEMCRRGIQQLSENDILDLLEKIRVEYPNVRAMARRDPDEFLKLLEERSSIIIKSGGVWKKTLSSGESVWEFRHLTFQEYLGARALIDGRYPGRNKKRSLAEEVGPLAGRIQAPREPGVGAEEAEVSESWREALRLLVSDCKDDDVDDVLLAVLTPLDSEDILTTTRPRSVLATLCLADEPNVSEDTAIKVLKAFALATGSKDGTGNVRTSVDRAGIEVGSSLWNGILKRQLLGEFLQRDSNKRCNPGGLWGMVEVEIWRRSKIEDDKIHRYLEERLCSNDKLDAVAAALTVMEAAFEQKIEDSSRMIIPLLDLLGCGGAHGCAAAWALLWLSGGFVGHSRTAYWTPNEIETEQIAGILAAEDSEDEKTAVFLINILAKVRFETAFEAVRNKINDPNLVVRQMAVKTIKDIDPSRAIDSLLGKIQDVSVRYIAVEALGEIGGEEAIPALVDLLNDNEMRDSAMKALLRIGKPIPFEKISKWIDSDEVESRKGIVRLLTLLDDEEAIEIMRRKSFDEVPMIAAFAVGRLLELGEKSISTQLRNILKSSSTEARRHVMAKYSGLKGSEDQLLLSRNLDGKAPWIDLSRRISSSRIQQVSFKLALSKDAVQKKYKYFQAELGMMD